MFHWIKFREWFSKTEIKEQEIIGFGKRMKKELPKKEQKRGKLWKIWEMIGKGRLKGYV